MSLLPRTSWRGQAASVLVAAAFLLAVAPALADKPLTVLAGPTPTTITAIAIDFDREHPSRKEFGKLIFRAGLNLYAKTSHFGGYLGDGPRSFRPNVVGHLRCRHLAQGHARL